MEVSACQNSFTVRAHINVEHVVGFVVVVELQKLLVQVVSHVVAAHGRFIEPQVPHRHLRVVASVHLVVVGQREPCRAYSLFRPRKHLLFGLVLLFLEPDCSLVDFRTFSQITIIKESQRTPIQEHI